VVAVDPDYCPRCGAALVRREVHHRERAVCPDCERAVFRNAVPSAGVIVRDDDAVLLIERATPPVGVWALPGGHPEYDEAPDIAAARELEEETGLRCAPGDLDLLTVVHDDHDGTPYLMVTYTVDCAATTGTLRPGEEATDVRFWAVERVLDSPGETREIDRRRIPLAFEDRD